MRHLADILLGIAVLLALVFLHFSSSVYGLFLVAGIIAALYIVYKYYCVVTASDGRKENSGPEKSEEVLLAMKHLADMLLGVAVLLVLLLYYCYYQAMPARLADSLVIPVLIMMIYKRYTISKYGKPETVSRNES